VAVCDQLNPGAFGAEKSPDSNESETNDPPLASVPKAQSPAATKAPESLFIEFPDID